MKQKYLKDVVTLKLDEEKCIGCGMCVTVCPHEVFQMNGRKVFLRDRDACMECGACALNCPVQALAVQSGVGCAYAIIQGSLQGTAPCCGPSDDGEASCCG